MIVGIIAALLGLFGLFTFLYVLIRERAFEPRLFWLSSGLFLVGVVVLLT